MRRRPCRSSSTCRCRRTARPGRATTASSWPRPAAITRPRSRTMSGGGARSSAPMLRPGHPVLALVPVETDFGDNRNSLPPIPPPPPPPPPPTPPTGLYMTAAHFRDDFEGWLKGDPEYELHILGQSGSSDSLTSYQCAGEHAGGYYAFDQNDNDWSGSVLLFSQTQLNAYKAAHPNQNVRILALEDDDGACQIRLDGNRFKTFQSTLQSQYPNLTGGKDSVSGLAKIFQAGERAPENPSSRILVHHLSGRPHRQRHRGQRGRRVPFGSKLDRARREQRDQRLAQPQDEVTCAIFMWYWRLAC